MELLLNNNNFINHNMETHFAVRRVQRRSTRAAVTCIRQLLTMRRHHTQVQKMCCTHRVSYLWSYVKPCHV